MSFGLVIPPRPAREGTPMRPHYEQFFEDSVATIGVAANLVIVTWHAASEDVRRIQRLSDCLEATSSRYVQGVGLLNVFVDGTPKFGDEVRAASLELGRKSQRYAIAGAHVIMLPGLRGTATRAFMSTLFLVGGLNRIAGIFRTTQEAFPWLLDRMSQSPEVKWSHADLSHVCIHGGVPGVDDRLPPTIEPQNSSLVEVLGYSRKPR